MRIELIDHIMKKIDNPREESKFQHFYDKYNETFMSGKKWDTKEHENYMQRLKHQIIREEIEIISVFSVSLR